MGGTRWPPPRLLTLMVESDLFSSERVPTWVGCRRGCGGAREVYLGSHKMELAVVNWLAMSRDEAVVDRAVSGREPSDDEECECAVLTVGREDRRALVQATPRSPSRCCGWTSDLLRAYVLARGVDRRRTAGKKTREWAGWTDRTQSLAERVACAATVLSRD